MNRPPFSLTALFSATFWSGVLIALCLAVLDLHDFHWPDSAWTAEKMGKQIFINAGFGIAVGGLIGGVRWPGMGMLLGALSTIPVTVAWLAFVFWVRMNASV